jgi:predicted glycoside hydrolase/deacetylase ChbG (UPF0249 family)
MVYFCADDYGISQACNTRIENCLKNGVLNKISVLPNGDCVDFKERLSGDAAKLSLHINLVEGHPLSDLQDVSLLVTEQGSFKYSFVGLLRLSFSKDRKEFQKQLYGELQKQVQFWKQAMGEETPLSIDSHQHTHMIPLIFKTLMQVIRDEQLNVESLRIPAEPLRPYLCTPSLYAQYPVKGLVKQWLLKLLALVNRRELKKSKVEFTYFMGALFSGRLTEEKIKKLLPQYLKLAEKHGKNIEIALHPGYLTPGEHLIEGCREDFEKFYFSEWRKKEYDTLMNFKY